MAGEGKLASFWVVLLVEEMFPIAKRRDCEDRRSEGGLVPWLIHRGKRKQKLTGKRSREY